MADWTWLVIGGAVAAVLYFLFLRNTPEYAEEAAGREPARPASDGHEAKGKPSTARAPESKPTTGSSKVAAVAPPTTPSGTVLPRLDDDEEDEEEVEPTRVGALSTKRPSIQPPTKRIVFDEDAAEDEPTNPGPLILITATAQTDKGLRRKRNEDNLLVLPEHGVYVVADGMGGYKGGEIASEVAVKTIEKAFREAQFDGDPHETIPSRASELARAIQMANDAILTIASSQRELEGMGTTICAARFASNKERLYVAHVGDSRLYRLRQGKLRQMTSDHTMKDFGVTGETSGHLSRAVGVWPTVPIDILMAKPQPSDLYLLCSDGLTKMVPDAGIAKVLSEPTPPAQLVESLIELANKSGGKDNVTVILIRVDHPARPGPGA
jgi:PPM family protein phosphatase